MKSLETVLDANQDVSAHLLGLDGWLLRTIPDDRRTIFLRLYEKALRTALHPDVIHDPQKKVFYERYIGRVAEAIAAMCEDSATYDAMSETVPTAKNRAVTLSVTVENYAGKIDDLRAEIEKQKAEHKAQFEVVNEQLNYYETQRKAEANRAAATWLVFSEYRAIQQGDRTHSTHLRYYNLIGQRISLSFEDGRIQIKQRRGKCTVVKQTGGATLETPNGNFKVIILGAITKAGLQHCKDTNELSDSVFLKAIENYKDGLCDDVSLALRHYLVKFFKPKMLLLCGIRGKVEILYVQSVDAIDDPAAEQIRHLNERVQYFIAENKRLTKKLIDA